MARRWFSRKGLTCESEEFDITVHDNTMARLNGSRILTDLDIPTSPSVETIELQNQVTNPTLTTTSTLVTWEGPFSPASTSGISLVTSNTIRITKKGCYQFFFQLGGIDLDCAVWFVCKKDGANLDGQNGVATKIGAELYGAVTCTYVFQQNTDTQHDFQFWVSGDAAAHYLANLQVVHFKFV